MTTPNKQDKSIRNKGRKTDGGNKETK